jgi:hypothetical protein
MPPGASEECGPDGGIEPFVNEVAGLVFAFVAHRSQSGFADLRGVTSASSIDD